MTEQAHNTPPFVRVNPAVCYTVRNGWAWAEIMVRHGIEKGDVRVGKKDRHWVHVAVVSDYGSFGFLWSHIGGDWRGFLSGLDMHYAMNKMMADRFMIDLPLDEMVTKAKAYVLDARKTDQMEKGDARTLWDALRDPSPEFRSNQTFIMELDDQTNGIAYRHEMWDLPWKKVNPAATEFWEKLWVPFAEQLKAEMQP